MKVHVNEKYVQRRAAIGKWVSLLGLVVLGVGFVVSLQVTSNPPTSSGNQVLFFFPFAALAVGFLLSNVGIYFANRYTRSDRPNVILAQALKGLDNRYALYQFLLPVSQVLREPGGLTIMVLKPQEGQIILKGDKWRNKQGWSRLLRWIGQEGLGKPEQEVAYEVQSLQEWLNKKAPDLDVPIRGAVVFTHPSVELDLDDPPIPAMVPKQLKGWLRKSGKLPPLSEETFDRLCQILDQAAQVDENGDDEA